MTKYCGLLLRDTYLRKKQNTLENAFPIIYEDEELIAIDKPTGILVHRTRISEDTQFVLQLLRDQLGYRIYPIHRLDRATSGVLLFAKNKIAANTISILFREQKISKTYLAVVRGHVDPTGIINYPIARSPRHEKKEAISHYRCLDQTEIDAPISRYPTSRYSYVEVTPQTGRHHQIRKHFAHLRHPILGDRPHGDCKHNKYFREVLGIHRMLLHAATFSFIHSATQKRVIIEAPIDLAYVNALNILEFAIV